VEGARVRVSLIFGSKGFGRLEKKNQSDSPEIVGQLDTHLGSSQGEVDLALWQNSQMTLWTWGLGKQTW